MALAKSQKADAHRDLLKPGFYKSICPFTAKWTARRDAANQGHADRRHGQRSGRFVQHALDKLFQAALCSLTEKERQAFLATVAKGEARCPLQRGEGLGRRRGNRARTESVPRHKSAAKKGNVAFVPPVPPKA